MMGTVTKLHGRMRKDELVRHLNGTHGLPREITPKLARGYTVESLVDLHRLIHVGLGAGADHTHGGRVVATMVAQTPRNDVPTHE
jgi:hypothetical protein